jgi:hypothetical protein
MNDDAPAPALTVTEKHRVAALAIFTTPGEWISLPQRVAEALAAAEARGAERMRESNERERAALKKARALVEVFSFHTRNAMRQIDDLLAEIDIVLAAKEPI